MRNFLTDLGVRAVSNRASQWSSKERNQNMKLKEWHTKRGEKKCQNGRFRKTECSSLGSAIRDKKETLFSGFHNKAYCLEVYKQQSFVQAEMQCEAWQMADTNRQH